MLSCIAVVTDEDFVQPAVVLGVEVILQEVAEPGDRKFVAGGVFTGKFDQLAVHEAEPIVCFFGMNEVADEQWLAVKVKAHFPTVTHSFAIGFANGFTITIGLGLAHRFDLLFLVLPHRLRARGVAYLPRYCSTRREAQNI